MAQHDYVIDNSTGANVRADINNVLQAIASNNSGSSAPSSTFALQFYADTTNNILKLRNAANDGFINLFTLAGGVDVDAASNFNEDVTFTGASANIVFDKSDNALEFADNAQAKFGTGSDFEIYFNGTNAFIDFASSDLFIRGTSGNQIRLQPRSGEDGIKIIQDGAVELYHDNSKKFETTSAGVSVSGFTNLGGEVKFDNDTNSGLDIRFVPSTNSLDFSDNVKAQFGAGNDLQIYHDGSNSYIDETKNTNNLFIRGQANINIGFNSEIMAQFSPNGHVQLYYDNAVRAATINDGFRVRGKQYLSREDGGIADHANFRQAFFVGVANGGSGTATVTIANVHAGGTVTVFASRGLGAPNATVATCKRFAYHNSGSGTSNVGAELSSTNGSGGAFSFSISATSSGITITNPSVTFNMNCFVTFDLTGFV